MNPAWKIHLIKCVLRTNMLIILHAEHLNLQFFRDIVYYCFFFKTYRAKKKCCKLESNRWKNICSIPTCHFWVLKIQGWEFAHWFFQWFARFLWVKQWFARKKEQIAPLALLSWAAWANCSHLLFCHEGPRQIVHGHFFVKSDRIKSLKSLFKK